MIDKILLYKNHWLTADISKINKRQARALLGAGAWPWMKASLCYSCKYVVIAYGEGNSMLGFLRLQSSRRKAQARGTYVAKKYRRQGVGLAMWLYAIDHPKLNLLKISVLTLSGAGADLVESVGNERPNIKWEWSHDVGP